jgi:hypothetical protein
MSALFEVIAEQAEQQALTFFGQFDGAAKAEPPAEAAPAPAPTAKVGPAKRGRA